jgi:hypothetical protein
VYIAAALMAGSLCAQSKSLSIGSPTVTGANVAMQVTMSSDTPVEGFVLSVALDPNLAATNVRGAGATIANNAELVVAEILSGGFTLGVIMDFDEPYDGQTIPAGTNILIAEADLVANLVALGLEAGMPSAPLSIEFRDGLNDPPLSNVIVVAGGVSVSVLEGLELLDDDASVTVYGRGDDLWIVPALGDVQADEVAVSVVVDNTKPLDGFVLSVAHVSALTLDSIVLGAQALEAEFTVEKLYNGENGGPFGGTFGVVMDFESPYNGQTVLVPDPVIGSNELAVFTYSRPDVTCTEPVSDVYELTLARLSGAQELDNALVVDGGALSMFPNLLNGGKGTVTFRCDRTEPLPPEGFNFYIGGEVAPGTAPAGLTSATGLSGTEAKVVVYYTSNSTNPQIASQPIQGMSMAIRYPTALQVVDLAADGQGIVDATHTDGTITRAINAEFVSFNADNTKGELVVGILVDSTPPVPLNHMYPPCDTLGEVLNLFFYIPVGTPCNTSFALEFVDGLTGAGTVPIRNRVAVFNASYPATVTAGSLTVGGSPKFIRGDCNMDQSVDIADPAATMSHLFLGVYAPECMDACDSNDDGVVDLADAVSTLRFLFKLGKVLPAPYPLAGSDPTPDIYGLDLGCVAGDPCN